MVGEGVWVVGVGVVGVRVVGVRVRVVRVVGVRVMGVRVVVEMGRRHHHHVGMLVEHVGVRVGMHHGRWWMYHRLGRWMLGRGMHHR